MYQKVEFDAYLIDPVDEVHSYVVAQVGLGPGQVLAITHSLLLPFQEIFDGVLGIVGFLLGV